MLLLLVVLCVLCEQRVCGAVLLRCPRLCVIDGVDTSRCVCVGIMFDVCVLLGRCLTASTVVCGVVCG